MTEQSDLHYANTPDGTLNPGEERLTSFQADRATYLRDHATMAAIAMGLGMVILWAIGNPHVWTGAIGGLAAVALRGWYVASDELAQRWDLTNHRLLGPGGRSITLGQVQEIKTLMSAVQVVTRTGGKHLIKYQADSAATKAQIEQAKFNQPHAGDPT
ncbi:hypothetical protein N4R57_03895 [Rhodobacteraceae bacterium D3-12]|nr:hypothetical protein N4R57_03895 [Rhodobacteraceae bacterium D3-12]